MKYKIILLGIFFLSFILRFWQLGSNPASLDWDEASLGYNAYSLLATGRDEYGTILPLSIRSFNDYKPPLYVYLSTIPIALFGLTEYAVRFTSAFFGVLAIIIGYFLVKELFPQYNKRFHLLFTLIFALSPWHIQFSRIAFEANVALTLMIAGVWFWLKGLKSGIFTILSFLLFVASTYAYHSPRLIVPLLIIGLFIIYRRQIRKRIAWYLISLIMMFILLLPLLAFLRSSTAARFGSVTILNPAEQLDSSIKQIDFDKNRQDILGSLTHNRRVIYAREILSGYLDHFNFDFLFLKGDAAGRHHAVDMGMLYFWDLPFILIGIYYLLNHRNGRAGLIFLWFLVAPVASAVTKATPHAVRSLFYLPTYQVFIAIGLYEFMRVIYQPKIKRVTVAVIASILTLNIYYYLHMYWRHTPLEYADSWQYGYKELVQTITPLEKSFRKVVVSYKYDQPYIYFLFYQKLDPSWYQENWGSADIKRDERNFGKFEFRNIDWGKDSQLTNTIIAGTPKEIPADAPGIIKEIRYPNGSVAWRIVAR